jgi:hypothetical protein
MQIPAEIVACIRAKKCILFLGAGVNAPSPVDSPFGYRESEAPPRGSELARRLLARCQECPDIDPDNLQRVALFFQFRPSGTRSPGPRSGSLRPYTCWRHCLSLL